MAAEVRANRNSLSAPVADRDFRALAENIPTLCWIADADGYIYWYNRRWYDYTGTTPETMEGWGWQAVHDIKSLAEVLERWKASISAAEPFEMLVPIRGADGQFRPFLTRINPAFDDKGTLVNWFGVNTDISRQIEAETAFSQSEAKFRVLADSMPQMVWSASPSGACDYFNARWYEFTGVPIGSTDGEAWNQLIHPGDRAAALTAWGQCLASGAPLHTEFRLRHVDGSYRWVLGRAQAERNGNDKITQWYGTFTDIEELVQARHVLKRSNDELEAVVRARTGERNLLATLVETTDVMIKAVDLDYRILAINPANIREFERIYGVRAKVGDNLLALLDDQPEQRDTVQAGWSRALAGDAFTITEERGHPSRSRGFYELKFRPLCNEAGAQIGAFQFVEDVTRKLRDQALLAEAQEALLQAQKLESMGQLTGGVAHDFNNLLTPIIGTLDLLQRRSIGGEREQRLIHGAYQSAERARILVQRLLAFARRQPLQSISVDIAVLIEGLADLVASATGPNVTFRFDIAENLPAALADPTQLEMAIINLSMNARDAMDGTGVIEIAATFEIVAPDQVKSLNAGRYVRIAVSDTGKGMDEATLTRAIEPFFSTKGIGKGTGLGLSMAHGLAAQLGGTLTIDSKPGLGTEVAIWLPECLTAQRASDPCDHRQNHPTSLGAVLLVDDDELIRASTLDMLTELGFSVAQAASAEAALAAIDGGLRPDILITDHLMPGMSGVELARAVIARAPAMRILIVSGFAEADGIPPDLPHLPKPFVQSDLISHLCGTAPTDAPH